MRWGRDRFNYKEWHRWFAWYPVNAGNEQHQRWVWWEWVWRVEVFDRDSSSCIYLPGEWFDET